MYPTLLQKSNNCVFLSWLALITNRYALKFQSILNIVISIVCHENNWVSTYLINLLSSIFNYYPGKLFWYHFFWYRNRIFFLTYLISNFDTLIPPGMWILDIFLDWFWTCDLHSGIRFWTYAIFSHGIRFWTYLIFNFDTLDTPVWKFWLTYRFWLMGIKIAGQNSIQILNWIFKIQKFVKSDCRWIHLRCRRHAKWKGLENWKKKNALYLHFWKVQVNVGTCNYM